jgi:DNA processing protein
MMDERAFIIALAGLAHMGPSGLRLLAGHHPPEQAWAVATGRRLSEVAVVRDFLARTKFAALWRSAEASLPSMLERRCRDLGVRALLIDDGEYPPVLAADPQAPAVLFAQGDLSVLQRRRVGVVGTRHATATGRATAEELARGLANHHIAVVSGLARGIDGAAHRAVLDAGGTPIGVVASGHDVVYPREHASLWRAVGERGLLLSELPPGCRPETYRFPLRNRILAVLSEVLVVVESRSSGGSLITAEEAARRGRPVLAVPGSVRNPAAQGTNDLIADGAAPARDLDDVLMALGLQSCDRAFTPIVTLDGLDRCVDEALAEGGRCLEDLLSLTGVPLGVLMRSILRLEAAGLVVVTDGWFERGHAPWGRP